MYFCSVHYICSSEKPKLRTLSYYTLRLLRASQSTVTLLQIICLHATQHDAVHRSERRQMLTHRHCYSEQYRDCTYNVTLRCVRPTIVVVEKR